MPITHIIFDFDGTLADTGEIGRKILNDLCEKFGYAPLPNIKQLPHSLLEEITKRKISKFQIFRIVRAAQKQLAGKIKDIACFPEIPELIRNLSKQGFHLGIMSSNNMENIHACLTRWNIEKYFEHFVTSPLLFQKHRKLKRYLKKYRIPISSAVYVGDETRDVEAGKKISMHTIAVSWGFESEISLARSMPDSLCKTPEELFEIIQAIKKK